MVASGGKIEPGEVQGTVQGPSDQYMTGMCVLKTKEGERKRKDCVCVCVYVCVDVTHR